MQKSTTGPVARVRTLDYDVFAKNYDRVRTYCTLFSEKKSNSEIRFNNIVQSTTLVFFCLCSADSSSNKARDSLNKYSDPFFYFCCWNSVVVSP